MEDPKTNLLVCLHKWVHRQDENFQTEAFVHLLQYLLDHEPHAAVVLLGRLTGGILCLRPEEASVVSVDTQVTTTEGRPDVEVRTPRHLVYVEAKVESGVGPEQLASYRKALKASPFPITCLVILTRYIAALPGGKAAPEDVFVRWYQVADWLEENPLHDPVSIHIVGQFVHFLKARGMSMDKVDWEFCKGTRAIYNFFAMVREVAAGLGLQLQELKVDFKLLTIGSFSKGNTLWIGVEYAQPQMFKINTYNLKVDKGKAETLGYGDGIFDSDWPKETQGQYRWGKQVDLDSEAVHFFSRSKASQMQYLEHLFKEILEVTEKIKAKD